MFRWCRWKTAIGQTHVPVTPESEKQKVLREQDELRHRLEVITGRDINLIRDSRREAP